MTAREHGDSFDGRQRVDIHLGTVDWQANDSQIEIPSVDPIWQLDPSCDIQANGEPRIRPDPFCDRRRDNLL
jgi:hypothetical protein